VSEEQTAVTDGIVETITITLPVRLLAVAMPSGKWLYLANIPDIACGSGATPDEAYAGLANALTYGDEGGEPEETLAVWQAAIQAGRTPKSDAPASPSLFDAPSEKEQSEGHSSWDSSRAN
jgi:hypothetical protein